MYKARRNYNNKMSKHFPWQLVHSRLAPPAAEILIRRTSERSLTKLSGSSREYARRLYFVTWWDHDTFHLILSQGSVGRCFLIKLRDEAYFAPHRSAEYGLAPTAFQVCGFVAAYETGGPSILLLSYGCFYVFKYLLFIQTFYILSSSTYP